MPEKKIRQEPFPPPQEAEPFPPPAKGERGGFNIKLSGGMGYFLNGGGDLENVRTGTQNFFSDIGALTNYTSTFDWNKLSLIPDFSAEIIFDFAKYFGIGVGVGVINGTSKGQASWDCNYSESALGLTNTYEASDTIDTSYKISAIPIKFNLYFFMPGSSVSLYAYSGLGLYMGKLTHEMTYDYLYHYTADSTFEFENSETGAISEEATCKKIGFNGGLGLIYKLSSSVGLGLEFYGRMVNLNNWEGDGTESYSGKYRYYTSLLGWYLEVPYQHSDTASGKYWFYNHKTCFTGNSYEMMSIAASQPSGSFVSNVRQAEINLNNFGVKLSIIIRFGLF